MGLTISKYRSSLSKNASLPDIELGSFILSAALVLVIAFISIGYEAIKAATANPVDALRYE